MKNPERLIATQRGVGLALLQAGDCRHQPPAGLLERTLTHVGVAGAVATSVSTQAAAQALSGLGPAAKTVLVTKTTSLAAVFIKAMAIGGGVGAITITASIGVHHLVRPEQTAPVLTSATSSARRMAATHQPLTRPATSLTTPPTASAEVTQDVRLPRSASPSGTTTPEGQADSVSLAAEAKLMSQAQSALEHGNRALALELLEQHRLEFPTGQLIPEATLLRVRALKLRHSENLE